MQAGTRSKRDWSVVDSTELVFPESARAAGQLERALIRGASWVGRSTKEARIVRVA